MGSPRRESIPRPFDYEASARRRPRAVSTETADHGGCDFDLTGSRMRQSARQDDQRLVGMINGIINELSIDDRVVTWCAADNTTDRVVEHVGHRTAHRLGAIALAPSPWRHRSRERPRRLGGSRQSPNCRSAQPRRQGRSHEPATDPAEPPCPVLNGALFAVLTLPPHDERVNH
jgi:hypothetical protein